MREQGFEYEPRHFVEPRNYVHNNLFLTDAAAVGYGGVLQATRLALDPAELGIDVSPELGDVDERLAYDVALHGVQNLEHVHETLEDHDHGEDHSHHHDAVHGQVIASQEPEGCLGRGQSYRSSLSIDEDLSGDKLYELDQRLISSHEFQDFSVAWVECMSESGNVVLDSDAMNHVVKQRSRYADRAFERIGELADAGRIDEVLGSIDIEGHQRAEEWVELVALVDPPLGSLLDEERVVASSDRECRTRNRAEVDAAYEQALRDLN